MADTLTTQSATLATIPAASVIATDDAGASGHVQIVKLALSADGSAVPITADANGIEVQGAGTAGAAAGGVVSVQGVASMTALQVADNGGSLTVDNAALSVVGGGVEAAAVRVTVASDSTGVLSVDDNGGSLTVDNAALSVVGGGVEAAALRVTLASDSTGVLSVDDNGGSLTVDGAVTVSGTATVTGNKAVDDASGLTDAGLLVLGIRNDGGATRTNLNGDFDAISLDSIGRVGITDMGGTITVDGTVTANLAAGTNNIGDVDVLTLPALPAGTNNIGDVDVLSIAAGDNNIGNVDIVTMPNVTLAAGTNTNEVVGDAAEDAVLAGNPVRVGVRASAALPTAMSADGDVVTPYADLRGRLVTTAKAGTSTLSNVSGSASSVTVLAANTSRLGAIVYNDSAAVLYLKFGATASTTSFSYYMGPGATVEVPFGYTGVLDGIWASATGAARVTEIT